MVMWGNVKARRFKPKKPILTKGGGKLRVARKTKRPHPASSRIPPIRRAGQALKGEEILEGLGLLATGFILEL
ncbi:hypothetical protein COS81_03440 [candidate division WWE3 bacterium CG06_land_8_20_14_3_00_42_16]|uniref:Uncharacterized protein n=1 Tax=candidate division WWE3 bacterium CG06_land_8_20_14_3_00_42_16 TaxID=1975083 RepID=A0A2M7AMK0_UNCKA|nr:MAG: hypothetical protein COS81_03440 [candidate division WWE3 bacterium CG06_land_8_20_14_3_00_42_16]